MATLSIKYRLDGKALPPRPIRVSTPYGNDEAGNGEPASSGLVKCPAFADGLTQGVELLFPYDARCEVVNEEGAVRFEWDPADDAGDTVDGELFTLSPSVSPHGYLFDTMLDLQAPPGYVLRTEPHPRCLADPTGTSPTALYAVVESQWWPRHLQVGFHAPPAGGRHVFRKGEPYARILFIPQDEYELVPMTPEEEDGRRRLAHEIALTRSLIGKNGWDAFSGTHFNDHYDVLSRGFGRDGLPAVESMVREAMGQLNASVPESKSATEYLELSTRLRAAGRLHESMEALRQVTRLAPDRAEGFQRLAVLEWESGAREAAIQAMARAAEIQPGVAHHHSNLGEMYRELGRLDAARASYETAVRLDRTDLHSLTRLGLTLAQSGLVDEGLHYCRRAIDLAPGSPAPRVVTGLILAQEGRAGEARACYEAALLLDPNFAPARQLLGRTPGDGASAPAMRT